MAEQQSSGANSADDLMWGIIGGIIAIGLLWFAFHTQIVIGFLYLADYKLRFIESFISSSPGGYLYSLREWINGINPYTMGFDDLMVLNKAVGKLFMVPTSIILLYWAFILYNKPSYSRKLDTDTLIKSESTLWPEIIPSMAHDILNEDPIKGKWAVSRSPVEFIEHFKIIDKQGDLITDKAEKVLIKQLGKPYKGLKSLSKYELALFGVFSACIIKDKSEAELALSLLNQSYDGKDINPEPGVKLATKYYKDERIQEIIRRHHFKNTVMYQMLFAARESAGVLPSSNFLWLKPLQRHTWYIMNNVGRKVAWADVSAVFSHWNAELIHKNPIPKPYLTPAIKGLEKITRERVIKY